MIDGKVIVSRCTALIQFLQSALTALLVGEPLSSDEKKGK
jgi:hypothetical protein